MRKSHRVIVSIMVLLVLMDITLLFTGLPGIDSARGESITPIKINSDAEFASQAIVNHWTGDGSADNPYIIENYTIDARGYTYGIYIGNTTVDFIVRNCTISGAKPSSSPYFPGGGITFYNVVNGSVDGVELNGNVMGMVVKNSREISVNWANVSGGTKGIYAYSGENVSVAYGNVSSVNGDGIIVENGKNVSMEDVGLYSNVYNGVHIVGGENIVLASLEVRDSQYYDGIRVENAKGGEIKSSEVRGNGEYGIYFADVQNFTVQDSRIAGNLGRGIYLQNSFNNTIYNNIFNNSENAAVSGEGTNWWNASMHEGMNIIGGPLLGGNFWATPDGDGHSQKGEHTGIGLCNESYEIAVNNTDYYPLRDDELKSHVITYPGYIKEPGDYVIVENLNWSDAFNGIWIMVSNVSIDGEGHTLKGGNITQDKGPMDSNGIYVHAPNARVENVSIENLHTMGWRNGVHVNAANDVHVRNLNSSYNIFDGIHIVNGSSNITMENSQFLNDTGTSVYVKESSYITIEDVRVAHSGNDGIHFEDCSHILINNVDSSYNGANSLYFGALSSSMGISYVEIHNLTTNGNNTKIYFAGELRCWIHDVRIENVSSYGSGKFLVITSLYHTNDLLYVRNMLLKNLNITIYVENAEDNIMDVNVVNTGIFHNITVDHLIARRIAKAPLPSVFNGKRYVGISLWEPLRDDPAYPQYPKSLKIMNSRIQQAEYDTFFFAIELHYNLIFRNNTIMGGRDGIFFDGTEDYFMYTKYSIWNSIIENNRFINLTKDVIAVDSGGMINTIIRNNTIVGNSTNGIVFKPDNKPFSNSEGGYVLTDYDQNYYQNSAPVYNVSIMNNSILSGGEWGIYFSLVTNYYKGSLEPVRVDGNLFEGQNYGIKFEFYNRANWFTPLIVNNTIRNSTTGIDIGAKTMTNATIVHNVIEGCELGIFVNETNNTIYDNIFNNTKNVEIGTEGANNTWNTTVDFGPNIIGGPLLGGNYWATPNGTGFSQTHDVGAMGFTFDPYDMGQNNTDEHPLGYTHISGHNITGCTYIVEPGTYYLTENLSVDCKYGIYIATSNVTIIGNGYWLNRSDGNTFDDTAGIYISYRGTLKNIRIENLNMRHWHRAAYINNAENITFYSMRMSDMGTDHDFFYAENVKGLVCENLQLDNINSRRYGIHGINVENLTMKNLTLPSGLIHLNPDFFYLKNSRNLSFENVTSGVATFLFRIESSENVVVSHLRIINETSVGTVAGITFYGSHNILVENVWSIIGAVGCYDGTYNLTVRDSRLIGYYGENSRDSLIENVTFKGVSWNSVVNLAVNMRNMENVTITNSTLDFVYARGVGAIYLGNGQSFLIENTSIKGGNDASVYVNGAKDVRIVGCEIRSSTPGVKGNGENVSVENSRIHDMGTGISLDGTNIRIEGNEFYNISNDAISGNMNDALISDNMITGGECGVHITGGSNATVERNRIEYTKFGIRVENAQDIHIRNNRVMGTIYHGIYLDNVQGGEVNGNVLPGPREFVDDTQMADTSTGLMAWWNMDEGSGTELVDHSGNGNDGTIVNGTWVSGHSGTGLYFNGSGYASVPMVVDYEQLTVVLWFRADDLSNGNARLIANSHTDEDKNGFQMMFNSSGQNGFFDVGNGTDVGNAYWSYSLKEGVWYFAALVYDGHSVKAYINGTLVGEAEFEGGAIADSGYDVMLGRNPAYSDTDFFNGTLDDVRIYSRALSFSELMTLYGREVAYYSFDEGSGTVAKDNSGNGYDGTIVNGTWVVGHSGTALDFNATGYLDVPMTVNWEQLTIMLWFKADDFSTNARLIANSNTDQDKNGFQVVLNSGGGSIAFDVGNGTAEGYVKADYHFQTGRWYFAALVYDGHKLRIYINALLMSDAQFDGGAINLSGYNINIGRDPAYDYTDLFNGSVDELRIYARALNYSEIMQNYGCGGIAGIKMVYSKMLEIYNNDIENYTNGMNFVNVDNTKVHNNRIGNSTSYGVWVDSQSGGDRFYNNSFYFNNGSNDTYNESHVQAYDAGLNFWNTPAPDYGTHGYGNFWYDWQSPDDNGDGIVDLPYSLDGGAKDDYPRTNAQPIPEISPLLLLIGLMVLLSIIFRRHRL